MADIKINEKLVVSQTGTAEPVLASNVDLSSATGIPAAGITGTLGSGVTLPTVSQDAWLFGRSTNAGTSYSGAVIDFDIERIKGSNITESAGTITIGTSGLYWISTMLTCHGTSDDFDFYYEGAKISVGNFRGGRHYDSDSHAYHLVQMSTIIQMTATDTIAVYGDAVNVYGTGLMSVFQGFRIGGNE